MSYLHAVYSPKYENMLVKQIAESKKAAKNMRSDIASYSKDYDGINTQKV
jgi:hypothetical protein